MATKRNYQSGTNKWDVEQRRVVLLLFERTALEPQMRRRLFNHLFRDHLRGCGLPDGLTLSALNAQWRERARKSGQWGYLLQQLSEDEILMRQACDGRLDAALTILGHSTAQTTMAGEKAPAPASQTANATRKRAAPKTASAQLSRRVRTRRNPPTVQAPGFAPIAPKKQRPGANILFTQRTGAAHWITPKEYADTQAPIRDIPDSELHPPLSGLMFRWWNNDSHGVNSASYFVAGLFRHNNIPSEPPSRDDLPWTAFESHINQHPVATPFVSVTNQAVRVLRIAMLERLAKEDGQQKADPGHVTVLNASALDPRTVFHAKPMFDAARRKWRPWTEGVFRYGSSHEFLIWHEIPASAIVHTFSMSAFRKETEGVLSLTMLRDPIDRMRASLKNCGLKLTLESVKQITRIVPLFGLGIDSPIGHIQHLITDLVRGWEVQIDSLSSEAWLELADCFVTEVCQASNPNMTIQDFALLHRQGTVQSLRAAFIYGIRGSRGKLNTLLDPSLSDDFMKRAARKGLGDPLSILTQEFWNDAFRDVREHDVQQRRLLGQPVEDGELAEKIKMAPPTATLTKRRGTRTDAGPSASVAPIQVRAMIDCRHDERVLRREPRDVTPDVPEKGPVTPPMTPSHTGGDENYGTPARISPAMLRYGQAQRARLIDAAAVVEDGEREDEDEDRDFEASSSDGDDPETWIV